MNEELIETTKQDIEVIDSEVIEKNIVVEESEQDVAAEVAMEAVEVEPAEEIVIDVDESIGWVGGDSAKHYSLIGRSEPDQHPISAITDLRAELDEIERLKTVYSDKIGIANFYKWHNGAYDEFGYFVSLVPHTSEITVCDGGDIFGVTVDGTMVGGFVGGQDENTPRDNTYALVTTSGLVDVRCELDVEEGSYVVSNSYGIATKTDSGCGYKVIAIEDKNGVPYAVIALGVQACTTDVMGQQIQHLDERMSDAESNIVSAINVANQAYSKALEVVSSNQLISDKVDDALDVVDKVTLDVDDLESQVSNSTLISEQARAIAESAATSAESMRNKAVEKANEALAETSELRKEFEAMAAEMDTDLENAALELQATKENIENTKNSLQDSIDNAVSDIETLQEDLEPLATWPDAKNPTGIAGFVARANDDSATLASIVTWKGDAGESLAGFVQEATENNATVSAVASYIRKDADGNVIEPGGAAGLTAQVDANQSELNAVASYEKDGAKGLAGLKAQVDANKSELSAVASYENGDASGLAGLVAQVDANKSELSTVANYSKDGKTGLAGLAAYVDDHEASVSNLAEYEQKDEDGNVLSTGTAGLIAQVDANKSSIELLSKFEGDNSESLAGLIAKTDANSAAVNVLAERVDGNDEAIAGIQITTDEHSTSINNLTSWQSDSNIAMARIEQKADANGAYIQSTVSNMDKYSVGPYSQSYNFKLDQAKSVLTTGMVYVPTDTHTEELPSDRTFTDQYYYTWDGEKWVTSDAVAVAFSDNYVIGNANILYWYIPGDNNIVNENITYNSHTLYKWESYVDQNNTTQYHWVAVATLEGNSSSRAVSQIRQNTNSVVAEVTNARGSFATLRAKLNDTDANVTTVASWKSNVEGDVAKIATIEQKANDNGASIGLVVTDGKVNGSVVIEAINGTTGATIEADHINLNGYVTMTNLSTKGETVINGGNIATDTVTADSIYITDLSTLNASIGGWEITEDRIWHHDEANSIGAILYSPNIGTENNVFAIGTFTDSGETWDNAEFRVTGDGKLYATGAEINGKITTEEGKIGGWNLDFNSLYSGDSFETSSAFICTGSNTSQSIGGSGVINGWMLKAGANFGVTSSGAMYCSDIHANAGYIANFNIDGGGLIVEDSNDDGSKETTIVQPNNIVTELSSEEYLLRTQLTGGKLNITVQMDALDTPFVPFMYIEVAGVKYKLCMNPADMTIMAMEA